MTPLEELQLAHKRLSQLRNESGTHAYGTWSNEDDDEPMMRREIIGSHGAVGVMYDASHADLVVALHRTIDAQLAIIQRAIDWFVEESLAYIGPEDLALARAINGEA